MTEPDSQTFHISSAPDALAAKRKAGEIATDLGFDKSGSEQVMLIVAEMASNIHKHADFGVVKVVVVRDDSRKGLRIEAQDRGPGAGENLDAVLADGFSSVGTLGLGLGTVNRLADSMELRSDGGTGNHLIVEKWLYEDDAPSVSQLVNPFDIGAVSRARVHTDPNGDSFVIIRRPGGTLVAVIDGVGHGAPAHKAATAARRYVETHVRQPLGELFAGTARACQGTRGVVMALARFDWCRRSVQFASIGNIECRVLNAGNDKMFKVRRGLIGKQTPEPLVTETAWDEGAVMILHSDGVSGRWSSHEIARIINRPAAAAAQNLMATYGKDNDDATVLVVKDRKGIARDE